jgi:hypothetical protein
LLTQSFDESDGAGHGPPPPLAPSAAYAETFEVPEHALDVGDQLHNSFRFATFPLSQLSATEFDCAICACAAEHANKMRTTIGSVRET